MKAFMKKIILLVMVTVFHHSTFGLENETPSFLMEVNTGFAAGIEMPGFVPAAIKFVYPYARFGFTMEAGGLFSNEKRAFNLFLGPAFFVVNNPKIRMPVSLGFNLLLGEGKKGTYYGIGGIFSVNYSLTRNIYAGINIGIDYNFDNPYEEVVRINRKDAAIGIDPTTGNKIYPVDKDGNPVYETNTPVKENRNHIGNYVYIKPTIAVGVQY
jgi:hypothetical protein